jgi:predicted GNAT family N-acyltransferase
MAAEASHAAADRFTVRLVDWPEGNAASRAVREAVFIVEQSIPEALEWDDFDPVSRHAIAEDASGTAVGCGRLLPDGHIGRMAVLSAWRGRGVGSALLVRLVDLARVLGHSRVALNSQVQAMPFYLRHGFAAAGDEYLEAGIPHRPMARTLR